MYPVSSFRFPVQPPTSDPGTGSLVCISFSGAWLPFVIGALSQLMQETTWRTDIVPLETTINRVGDLINRFASVDCMFVSNIRVNGCLIEAQFGSDPTWVLIGTLDPCARDAANGVIGDMLGNGGLSTGQPGPPAGSGNSIPAGDCKEIDITVTANSPVMVPFRVEPGYTVQLISADGIWSKDAGIQWGGWAGQSFTLGVYGTTVPTTPAGSFLTGENGYTLLARYGSNYYSLPAKSVHLPGPQITLTGSQSDLFLLMNDSPIYDNAGSINAKIRVCNLTGLNWCALVDFTLSNGGFTKADNSASNNAVWTAGVGWGGTYGIFADCYISKGELFGPGVSVPITRMEYDIVQTAAGTPTQHGYLIGPNGQTDNGGQVTTSPATLQINYDPPFLLNQITFDVNAGQTSSGASITIKRFRLYGKGTIPPGYTPC